MNESRISTSYRGMQSAGGAFPLSMKAGPTLSLWAASVLLTSSAGATVGGPDRLRPLGYDVGDAKVYLLEEHSGEGEEPPQLWYIPLQGQGAGRMIRVTSLYRDDPTGELLAQRLSRISRRLRPLEPVPLDRYTLTTAVRAQGTEPDPGDPDHPWQWYELSLTISHKGAPWRRDGATVRSYFDARARLVSAWQVPGSTSAIAVAAYLGIPYEIGYEREVAVVVGAVRQR